MRCLILPSVVVVVQPGHLKVDCPQAPVKENGALAKACHACGEVGHLKRDCTKVRARWFLLESEFADWQTRYWRRKQSGWNNLEQPSGAFSEPVWNYSQLGCWICKLLQLLLRLLDPDLDVTCSMKAMTRRSPHVSSACDFPALSLFLCLRLNAFQLKN